jgi:O-antigen ligase
MSFLLHGIIRKKFGPFDRTELWMGAFFLIILASALFKSNVLGFSLRMAADAFAVPFLAYCIARRLITDEDRYRRFIQSIAYAGVSVIVISLIERITHEGLFYRLNGPFRSSNALYTVLVVIFFVLLSDSFQKFAARSGKNGVFPIAQRFVLYLAPVVILLTWSRGAWVGYFMGMGVFLVLGWRLLRRSQALVIIGLSLAITGLVSLGIHDLAESLERRVANTDTIYGRIATWNVAIQSGLREPVFGIGLNNLREVLVKNSAHIEGVGNFPRVHNSFLAILAEQGIVGLVMYCGIIASILLMGLPIARTGRDPRERWRGITAIAILASYLLPAMFASTIHEPLPFGHILVYAFWGAVAGRYGWVRTKSFRRRHVGFELDEQRLPIKGTEKQPA